MPLGVVVERREIDHPWQQHPWPEVDGVVANGGRRIASRADVGQPTRRIDRDQPVVDVQHPAVPERAEQSGADRERSADRQVHVGQATKPGIERPGSVDPGRDEIERNERLSASSLALR